MVSTLLGLREKTVSARQQDHSEATLAPILRKEDGQISFERTAGDIYNRLRGFQPWPGAYTTFRGKLLTVCSARPRDREGSLVPGVPPLGSLLVQGNRLYAVCKDSLLELLEVQPEGKKRMLVRDFLNGYKPQPNETFGTKLGPS